jgi:hypothetical protein
MPRFFIMKGTPNSAILLLSSVEKNTLPLCAMRKFPNVTCSAHKKFYSFALHLTNRLAKIGNPRTIHPKERGFLVTFLDAVTPLELERSVFDSDETRILSAAFEKAWAYVQSDPMLGLLEAWERQSELARCLMALIKLGDSNPVSLANSGITLVRKSQRIATRKRAA